MPQPPKSQSVRSRLVKCRDCDNLEPRYGNYDFCSWHEALISKVLVGKTSECEGFKPKEKGRKKK